VPGLRVRSVDELGACLESRKAERKSANQIFVGSGSFIRQQHNRMAKGMLAEM
jgi:hypothetical protein